MLAETANYAKRNVAEACDLLVKAGVLSSKAVGNRFYFSLAPGGSLADFVGAMACVAPNWNALLRVVALIVRLAKDTEEVPQDALIVAVHQAIRDIEDDLDVLNIPTPRRLRGAAVLSEWSEWAESVMRNLASGVWPGTGTESTIKEMAVLRRRKQVAARTR
ncbi:MAG: hypothetical protein ACYCST_05890 [Acidimicrobiales bacterium]